MQRIAAFYLNLMTSLNHDTLYCLERWLLCKPFVSPLPKVLQMLLLLYWRKATSYVRMEPFWCTPFQMQLVHLALTVVTSVPDALGPAVVLSQLLRHTLSVLTTFLHESHCCRLTEGHAFEAVQRVTSTHNLPRPHICRASKR